jgi:hypothetical protein
MKLFSKEIDKKLFSQYSKGSDLDNQVVVTKIFNPYGNGRWFLLNSDPQEPDYLWAIVQMGDVVEMGSVTRSELESVRVSPFRFPLERDLSFRMVNAGELFRGLQEGKFYKKGGFVNGYKKGGETEEGVDLFEDYENIPQNVQNVLDKYSDAFDDGSYEGLSIAKKELEKIGYTFEYGLGGGAYDLRQIGEKGKNEDEYAKGGELNLGIRKIAEQEGFTPKQLGKEYELVMAQAIVESLTDANFHNEARKLISLLENKPEWENKPEYGTKEYEKWEKSGVYNSKYWDADEKTRDFAIKVSQKSGWDGYAIASAFEYLVRIDGGYHKLADKIEKAMESNEEMAKGGYVSQKINSLLNKLEYASKNGKEDEFDKISNKIHEISDNQGLNESEYNRWDEIRSLENEKRISKFSKMAKGGGIYTSDSLYYLQVIKDDKEVAREKFRAKSLKEAKEISEEEYESNYISKYGNPLNFIVSEAMANGGEVEEKSRIKNISDIKIGQNVYLVDKYDTTLQEYKVVGGDFNGFVKFAWPISGNIAKDVPLPNVTVKYSDNENKDTNWELKTLLNENIFFNNKNEAKKYLKDLAKLIYERSIERISEYADGGELDIEGKRLADNPNWTNEKLKVEYDSLKKYLQNFNSGLLKPSKVIGTGYKSSAIAKRLAKKWLEDNVAQYKKALEIRGVMAKGGKVKFADKVKEVKASLLKRKKVSPSVQKDYGKTYSQKEAKESAQRIVGSMVSKMKEKVAKRKKK